MTHPTFNEEQNLWNLGYTHIIGIDEVGRGAFAGPVVVGAVVFEKSIKGTTGITSTIESIGINDSKLLNPQKREQLEKEIKNSCGQFAIAEVGVSTINKVGIGKATFIAMRKAIQKIISNIKFQILPIPNQENSNSLEIPKQNLFVLVDGFRVKYIRGLGLKHQKAIIKGDQKSISIAAASILAKVHRDDIMRNLHERFPHYGFYENKGYGTRKHRDALQRYGLSKIHRTSFDLLKFTRMTNF